jgi:hypothetical protein
MRRTLLITPVLLLAAAPAAAQGNIEPGQRVTGELALSDPRLDNGARYDVWRFQGQAEHRYRVRLHSDDFDAVVVIGSDARAGCDDCAFDDDGGGGTDAQAEYTSSQDGTFEIRANGWDESGLGRYELTLEDQGVAEPEPFVDTGTPIRLDETVTGELARGDTKLDGAYSDTYTYQGRAGETIVVTLRSEDFDAIITMGSVHAEGCTELDSDDNGGGGTDSELTLTLREDGPHHIHVSSVDGGARGAYTLVVARGAGPAETPAIASPVAEGETMEGWLMSGDAREGDGSYYDLWSYRGRAGETIRITLRSEDFDAYLHFGRMVDGRWQSMETNDDGAGGTDSQITVTLPETGEYLVHANAFAESQTGRYTLRVERN